VYFATIYFFFIEIIYIWSRSIRVHSSKNLYPHCPPQITTGNGSSVPEAAPISNPKLTSLPTSVTTHGIRLSLNTVNEFVLCTRQVSLLLLNIITHNNPATS
jgi:hypothetical protein